MHIEESDAVLLRQWLIKKLETISDADSEVLADYVLALLRTDESQAGAQATCIDNLQDFLGDNAKKFVGEVFQAIATKSYDPSRPTPQLKPSIHIYEAHKNPSYGWPSLPNESRKRSHHDWNAAGNAGAEHASSSESFRRIKQPRRPSNTYEGRNGRLASSSRPGPLRTTAEQYLSLPTSAPGWPQFDPMDSIAALFAMQQSLGLLPNGPSYPSSDNRYPALAQRCRDYDLKGYCTRGAACRLEHGDNAYVIPPTVEASNPTASLAADTLGLEHTNPHATSPYSQGGYSVHRGGRAKGRGLGRGSQYRADFSMIGPNANPLATALVVEQIPEANFNEANIHDFFSAFGSVTGIEMHPEKRLAIVTFDDHDAAQAAYSSPKSIFDNRFVKLYWYRPEKTVRPAPDHSPHREVNGDMVVDNASEFDLQNFARQQEEVQRRYEETKGQREIMQQRKAEIDEKLMALMQEQRRLKTLLAEKTGTSDVAGADTGESEQNRLLRDKLAELHAEAKSLGIDPDEEGSVFSSYTDTRTFRGRRGYRGRFPPRGRGAHHQPVYRGGNYSYRSNSTGFPRATRSLDNRPKAIAIVFADGTTYAQREEPLRHYLMFNGLETAQLSPHPSREDGALIAFQQRFEAENFVAAVTDDGPLATTELSGVLGKAELEWWIPNGFASGGEPLANKKLAQTSQQSMESAQPEMDAVRHDPEVTREERDMDTYDEGDDA